MEASRFHCHRSHVVEVAKVLRKNPGPDRGLLSEQSDQPMDGLVARNKNSDCNNPREI